MKILIKFILLFIITSLFVTCTEDTTFEAEINQEHKIDVVINDIPFLTEKYLRIPYTLKFWEYEKEGLKLQQIKIMDYNNNKKLMTIEKDAFPVIFKEPLDQNQYFQQDKISHYYLSIQLPIPHEEDKPSKIFHKFLFNDTINNKTVVIEGGELIPRLYEYPISISSPVKGKNWAFVNQSTMDYHFYVLFFMDGKIYCGERFAFDNLQMNNDISTIFEGDAKVNNSYFNYMDTLYAVADGKVIEIKDNLPENNGDAQDVTFNSVDELGGNYIIIDIGNGRFAAYAHCVPKSFMVKVGSIVKEGDPIALLGNSGNSTAPHLHFQIMDRANLLFSNGLPFVLKNFTKIAEADEDSGEIKKIPTTKFYNKMMEQTSVINFE